MKSTKKGENNVSPKFQEPNHSFTNDTDQGSSLLAQVYPRGDTVHFRAETAEAQTATQLYEITEAEPNSEEEAYYVVFLLFRITVCLHLLEFLITSPGIKRFKKTKAQK